MSEINLAAVAALRSIIDSLPPKVAVEYCPVCGALESEAHTRMCDDKAREDMYQDYLDNKEADHETYYPGEGSSIDDGYIAPNDGSINKEVTMDNQEFLYHSNKKGQLQSWNTDFNTAAFFVYKDVPYMLINGAWGVVCFNLNRAFWATDKTVIGFTATSMRNAFDYLVAWPNARMQQLLCYCSMSL